MQFYLTYEGELLGSSNKHPHAKHKHEIRKVFHQQLKRLWVADPVLHGLEFARDYTSIRDFKTGPAVEMLAEMFSRNGFRYVPLVISKLMALCKIEILFLRPDLPGGLLESGDIDNRLKTIFDALRLPQSSNELGGYTAPDADEDPFYCLLEDDKLIDSVAVTTGLMLQPLPGQQMQREHARVIINVKTHSGHFLMNNTHLR